MFICHHVDVYENYIDRVYMLLGIVVWAKVNSVSSVNCVQSAFLKFVNVRVVCCSL